ncbi:MAG: DUF4384 domain-containing protein [Roseimicrobium sp.]
MAQPQETPPPGSGVHAGSGGIRNYTINIVFGLGGLGLLLWFIKQPQQQPAVVLPPIHSENKINAGNHTNASSEKGQVIEPVSVVMPAPSAVVELIQVKLNRPSYKVGEEMHITVTSPQAGYLYVLAVWADGRVDTLFPNTLRPDARVAAGTRLRLPDDLPPNAQQERLTYPMSMPALSGNPASATESILAVLSPAPLDLPKSTELQSLPGFAAVGTMDDPDFRTRGPQPKFIKMQKAPPLDFGTLPQAALHYEIRR